MAMDNADGDLPEYCLAGVLVLGCGNPFMGDDGFGPAVAERLLNEGSGFRVQGSGERRGFRGQGSGNENEPKVRSSEPCTLNRRTFGPPFLGELRSPADPGSDPAPCTLNPGSDPEPCTLHPEPSICIINAGTGSRGIIFNMVTGPSRPKAIIIIDALQAGKRPGELFWVDIEDMSLEKAEDFSLHMTPASNMLLQLKEQGVEIRVLACEPKNLPEVMTEGLSPEVAGAVGPAAGMVLSAADEILKTA